jgi:hypothetical protein
MPCVIDKSSDYSDLTVDERAKYVSDFIKDFFKKMGRDQSKFQQLMATKDQTKMDIYLLGLGIRMSELQKLFVLDFLSFLQEKYNASKLSSSKSDLILASLTTQYPSLDYHDLSLRIEEFIMNNRRFNLTFSKYVLAKLDKSGETDVSFYKRCGLNRNLFSQLRTRDSAKDSYNPSKKTAITICLGLKLSLKEMNKCLKLAGYALSDIDEFDLTIKFFVENESYDIQDINFYLEEKGLPILHTP